MDLGFRKKTRSLDEVLNTQGSAPVEKGLLGSSKLGAPSVDTSFAQLDIAGSSLIEGMNQQDSEQALASLPQGDSATVKQAKAIMTQRLEADRAAGQALSNGLQQSLIAQLDRDYDEKVNEIAEHAGDDADAFTTRLEKFNKQFIGSMPKAWREDAEKEVKRRSDMLGDQVASQALEAQVTKVNKGLTEAQNNYLARSSEAIREGDAETANEFAEKFQSALQARTDLNDQQRAAQLAAFETESRRQNILGIFEQELVQGGVPAAVELIEGVRTSADIPEAERPILARQLKAGLADAVEKAELTRMEQGIQSRTFMGIQAAALADQIEQGEAGLHEIESAPFLRPEEDEPGFIDNNGVHVPGAQNPARVRLLAVVEKASRERKEKIGRVDAVAKSLGDGLFDPRNESHSKGLNEFYEERVLPQLSQLDPQVRAETEFGLVKQLGMIPERLARDTVTQLTHGTPEAALFAASSLMNLAKVKPEAIRTIPSRDISRAAVLSTFQDAGLDPAIAVERAKEAIAPTPAIQAEREADLSRTLEDNPFDKDLMAVFGDLVVEGSGGDVLENTTFPTDEFIPGVQDDSFDSGDILPEEVDGELDEEAEGVPDDLIQTQVTEPDDEPGEDTEQSSQPLMPEHARRVIKLRRDLSDLKKQPFDKLEQEFKKTDECNALVKSEGEANQFMNIWWGNVNSEFNGLGPSSTLEDVTKVETSYSTYIRYRNRVGRLRGRLTKCAFMS